MQPLKTQTYLRMIIVFMDYLVHNQTGMMVYFKMEFLVVNFQELQVQFIEQLGIEVFSMVVSLELTETGKQELLTEVDL